MRFFYPRGGKIIPRSEQLIYGIKELARVGIKSVLSGLITSVNVWDIQSYLKSGVPFKNKFLLLKSPLTPEQQINWELPVKTKGSGVWFYNFVTKEFIEYFDSVKACRDKYNIPSTTFKRIRKHALNYKGYLFSDNSLNNNNTSTPLCTSLYYKL